ncbi:MAG: hypothetical protein IKC82_01805 [Lentisphaeria bacterium]|nr:hypothetical protein [Lentisphaeria bacterium]
MNSCPECYGKYRQSEKICRQCEYTESCNYYTASENSMKKRKHWVSFEAAKGIIAGGNGYEEIIRNEEGEKDAEIIPALAAFFRYLLELDDYTLSLIREIIAPSVRDKVPNIRQLGKIHGCSRQAIHRKILRSIAIHPELAALFQGVMEKISAGRRTFLRHLAANA